MSSPILVPMPMVAGAQHVGPHDQTPAVVLWMPMHAQRPYDPGDVVTSAQEKIVVSVAARGDILPVARAKKILGATAESVTSKSANNAYKTPQESNEKHEKPNSTAARRAQKVLEDIFPAARALKLLESVVVAARAEKEVLVSNFNHDIQDQIKMVRTARNSDNTTASAMSCRVSKSNSGALRLARPIVANKNAASMMFRAVVSAEKAVRTSKQARNYREAVKGLEMAESMMSRAHPQAVSITRDQPQPVGEGTQRLRSCSDGAQSPRQVRDQVKEKTSSRQMEISSRKSLPLRSRPREAGAPATKGKDSSGKIEARHDDIADFVIPDMAKLLMEACNEDDGGAGRITYFVMPEVAELEKDEDEIGDDGEAGRITYFVMLETAELEQNKPFNEDDGEAERITYFVMPEAAEPEQHKDDRKVEQTSDGVARITTMAQPENSEYEKEKGKEEEDRKEEPTSNEVARITYFVMPAMAELEKWHRSRFYDVHEENANDTGGKDARSVHSCVPRNDQAEMDDAIYGYGLIVLRILQPRRKVFAKATMPIGFVFCITGVILNGARICASNRINSVYAISSPGSNCCGLVQTLIGFVYCIAGVILNGARICASIKNNFFSAVSSPGNEIPVLTAGVCWNKQKLNGFGYCIAGVILNGARICASTKNNFFFAVSSPGNDRESKQTSIPALTAGVCWKKYSRTSQRSVGIRRVRRLDRRMSALSTQIPQRIRYVHRIDNMCV